MIYSGILKKTKTNENESRCGVYKTISTPFFLPRNNFICQQILVKCIERLKNPLGNKTLWTLTSLFCQGLCNLSPCRAACRGRPCRPLASAPPWWPSSCPDVCQRTPHLNRRWSSEESPATLYTERKGSYSDKSFCNSRKVRFSVCLPVCSLSNPSVMLQLLKWLT